MYDDLKVAHFSIPKIKNGSRIRIGGVRTLNIDVDHHFNWFQKRMGLTDVTISDDITEGRYIKKPRYDCPKEKE